MGTPSPTHKPTPETSAEVRALASFGVPQDEIAEYLGIDPKTLRKYYRDEISASALRIHARVATFLANAATGAALKQDTGATFRDCLTAAIFYGKTRMGLREKQAIEITDERTPKSVSELSDGEIQRLRSVAASLIAGDGAAEKDSGPDKIH